ncbi:MAG: uroporphyrinogen-III C-methyltransferase [Lysobacterales bacterium CG02_land_8_20_14_3_00_62_12]|nr:MAG: uroporphyrinogen-III C-methyltransferase [Xanthomonadales bacterium CG02_land_8_20_14_3_00_62_12]
MTHSTNTPHRLFPVFADLRGRRVLVVGAGAVALRKIAALDGTGAEVVVVALRVSTAVQRLADAGSISLHRGVFAEHWLNGVCLVIAATDDPLTQARVARAATARQIWVNAVDDGERSSVQLPALVQRGRLQIAISTAGAAPMLARLVRERIESLFDEAYAGLVTLLHQQRAEIRRRLPDSAQRRRWLMRLLQGVLPGLLRAGQSAAAAASLRAALDDAAMLTVRQGSVVLVGAGPGDPGLLTLRALRVLNEADVILHDHLVSAEVLALARRDAQFIDVGKPAGGHGVSQDQIHAWLIEHAAHGARVVRLKGGDPFVFGRGGEELQALKAAGIAYEVVPGVTAALACAAYAGIPLTHRHYAQSLRLITAHCERSADRLDWASLAAERQTLAFYMGVAGLDRIRERLLAHGLSPKTPFALIENGSRSDQRVVLGCLEALPDLARQHAITTPTLLIVGEVAALARDLHWFGAAPIDAEYAAVAAAPVSALDLAA